MNIEQIIKEAIKEVLSEENDVTMSKEELKGMGESIAMQYSDEVKGLQISDSKLREMLDGQELDLTDKEKRIIIGYAKGLLYQWGPETEEDVENYYAGKEMESEGLLKMPEWENIETVVKEAVKEALSYLGEDFYEANTMGYQEEKSAQEEDSDIPIIGYISNSGVVFCADCWDEDKERVERARPIFKDSPEAREFTNCEGCGRQIIKTGGKEMDLEKVVKEAVKETLGTELEKGDTHCPNCERDLTVTDSVEGVMSSDDDLYLGEFNEYNNLILTLQSNLPSQGSVDIYCKNCGEPLDGVDYELEVI